MNDLRHSRPNGSPGRKLTQPRPGVLSKVPYELRQFTQTGEIRKPRSGEFFRVRGGRMIFRATFNFNPTGPSIYEILKPEEEVCL